METQKKNEAVFCPTKTGNGYKIVVNGVWFYTSKRALHAALEHDGRCTFRTIEERNGPQ